MFPTDVRSLAGAVVLVVCGAGLTIAGMTFPWMLERIGYDLSKEIRKQSMCNVNPWTVHAPKISQRISFGVSASPACTSHKVLYLIH